MCHSASGSIPETASKPKDLVEQVAEERVETHPVLPALPEERW